MIRKSDPFWRLGIRIYHPEKPKDKYGHGVKLTKEEINTIREEVKAIDPVAFKHRHKTEDVGDRYMKWLAYKGVDLRFLEMRETALLYL